MDWLRRVFGRPTPDEARAEAERLRASSARSLAEGCFAEAEKDARRASMLAQDHAPEEVARTSLLLARVLLERTKLDEAAEHVARALPLGPPALTLRARILHAKGASTARRASLTRSSSSHARTRGASRRIDAARSTTSSERSRPTRKQAHTGPRAATVKR